jgi:hypothetical protein
VIALLVAAVLTAALIGIARNQRRRRELDAATVELQADDDGVRRVLGDGRAERVRWASLVEVEVLTVDSGPHQEYGAVLVLSGADEEGCLAPVPLAVEEGIVDRLHRLPGFDGTRLVEALQAGPPARTTVWTRR